MRPGTNPTQQNVPGGSRYTTATAAHSAAKRSLPRPARTERTAPATQRVTPLHSQYVCARADCLPLPPLPHLVSRSSVSSALIRRSRSSTTSGVSRATSTAMSFTARGLQGGHEVGCSLSGCPSSSSLYDTSIHKAPRFLGPQTSQGRQVS